MAVKNIYSFDEKRDAEKILKEGFTENKFDSKEAGLLTKYYREVMGFGATRLEKEIISFCKKEDPNFNPIMEAESIKHWIKNAMSYKLRKIDSIVITKSEIESLKKIKDLKNRKVLFIALAVSKAIKKGNTSKNKNVSEKYYIHYNKIPLIMSTFDLVITEDEILRALRQAVELELIFPYNPERESILISFAKDESPSAIKIYQLDRALEYYRAFFGGDVFYCANCGEEIIKTGNKKKYCEKCAKEVKKIQVKEAMRRARKM